MVRALVGSCIITLSRDGCPEFGQPIDDGEPAPTMDRSGLLFELILRQQDTDNSVQLGIRIILHRPRIAAIMP
jgi:hypothetical protein